MATLKGQSIASSYQDLVKRADTYAQTGTNIELMDDSGDVQATGLYLESNATTSNVGIGTVPDAGDQLHISASDSNIHVQSTGTDAHSYTNYTGRDSGADKETFVGYSTTTDTLNMVYDSGLNSTSGIAIDSSGNVGIGETVPLGTLHIKSADSGASVNGSADELVVEGSGNSGMTIASGNTNEGFIMFADDGSQLAGLIGYKHNDDYMEFRTAAAERMRIDSSGDVTFTGDLIMADGKGINFAAMTTPADAGGMAAETLTDYEEGTWSPVYAPATGSFTTMTMDVQNASYTKIGRLVTVAAYMRTDNVDATGASGNLRITGLPFTSLGGDHHGCMSIGYVQDFASGEAPESGYVNQGQSYLTLTERSAVDGDSSNCQVDTLTTGAIDNDNEIMFNATYFTA